MRSSPTAARRCPAPRRRARRTGRPPWSCACVTCLQLCVARLAPRVVILSPTRGIAGVLATNCPPGAPSWVPGEANGLSRTLREWPASRPCPAVSPGRPERGDHAHPHGAEPAEPAAAGRGAAVPLAAARAARRRLGARGAHGRGRHGLARRQAGPAAEPVLDVRGDARPGRGPALHPRRAGGPRGARRRALVGRRRARRPRPAAGRLPAGAAGPRVRPVPGALPGQERDVPAALRLPAAAGRGRRQPRRRGRPPARVRLRRVGHRPVPLLRAGLPRAVRAGAAPERAATARRPGAER